MNWKSGTHRHSFSGLGSARARSPLRRASARQFISHVVTLVTSVSHFSPCGSFCSAAARAPPGSLPDSSVAAASPGPPTGRPSRPRPPGLSPRRRPCPSACSPDRGPLHHPVQTYHCYVKIRVGIVAATHNTAASMSQRSTKVACHSTKAFSSFTVAYKLHKNRAAVVFSADFNGCILRFLNSTFRPRTERSEAITT